MAMTVYIYIYIYIDKDKINLVYFIRFIHYKLVSYDKHSTHI
jgi:hypothetical protein